MANFFISNENYLWMKFQNRHSYIHAGRDKCKWCGKILTSPLVTFNVNKENFETPYCSRKCRHDDPESEQLEISITSQCDLLKKRWLEYLNSQEYKIEKEQSEQNEQKRKKKLKMEETIQLLVGGFISLSVITIIIYLFLKQFFD